MPDCALLNQLVDEGKAPKVKEMTDDYFERQPWMKNYEKRQQWKREGKKL